MSEEDTLRLALRCARSLGAWLGAVCAAAFVGAFAMNMESLLRFGPMSYSAFWPQFLLIAVLGGAASAPLAPLAVVGIRFSGLPRPWADIGCGVLAAVFALVAVALIFGFGALVLGNEILVFTAAFAAPAGGVAGLVYWMLAGMPKPDSTRAWWRNLQIDL